MAEKRKISIRKVIQVFFTLVVSVCCVVAIVSASKIEDRKMLASIAVHIKNDRKYHFMEEKEVLAEAMNGRQDEVMNTPIGRQDLRTIESNIKADPWVADAEVFIDKEKVLQIYVTQRVPFVRIFEQSSKSYFMDPTLTEMPLTHSYRYYTMVVTNVPELKNDSAGTSIKKQIAAIVHTIQADTFWNAQISQVIFDSGCNFEMIPVVGNQRILFGDTSRMKEKFNNLFVFYRKVLNRIGWDKYQTLDLRFKDQVVASPSLPYKAPVDKALDSWAKSFEEVGAREETRDSLKQAETKQKQADNTKDKNVKETGDKQSKDTNKKIDPKKPGSKKQTPDKKAINNKK